MGVTTLSIYQVSTLLSESIQVHAIFMSIRSLICTLSRALADDVDGDEVRCRWARSSDRECAGVCDAFPGAILDQVRTYVCISHVLQRRYTLYCVFVNK